MTEQRENAQWFAVQTYSGYENKVKANLEQRIASMSCEDKIFQVLIPMEERRVVKDGKEKKVTRKLYPSYVLVEMIMDDQSWYVVRHTPGVTGFVGAGAHPIPLEEDEVRELLIRVGQLKAQAPIVDVKCNIGDKVKVISGPFTGMAGQVVDINESTGKVKFLSTVFGHDTEVEALYTELENI